MLWFNFIFDLIFIVFCFKLIIIHYHTQNQKKIKIKPRIKLNHNIYKRFDCEDFRINNWSGISLPFYSKGKRQLYMGLHQHHCCSFDKYRNTGSWQRQLRQENHGSRRFLLHHNLHACNTVNTDYLCCTW